MGDATKRFGIEIRTTYDGKGFDAVGEGAKQAERDATQSARKTAAEWESSAESIRNKSAIAFAAVGAAIGLATREAAKSESSLLRARSAVEISGKSWDDYKDSVIGASSQLQEVTRFSDEDAADAFTHLTLATGDADQALQHLTLTSDMAAFTNSSMAESSRAIAQAIEGETGRMGMLIPALKNMNEVVGENATKAERQAYIIGVLQDKIGGFAEREGKSFTGQMTQIKNVVSDAAESVGYGFLPVIQNLVTPLADVVRHIGDWAKDHPTLVTAIGGGALVLTGFVAVVTSASLAVAATARAVRDLQIAMTALKVLNPEFLLLAGAITLVGGAVYYAAKDGGGLDQMQYRTKQANEATGESVRVLNIATGEWTTITKAQADAVPQIGATTSALDQEADAIRKAHEAMQQMGVTLQEPETWTPPSTQLSPFEIARVAGEPELGFDLTTIEEQNELLRTAQLNLNADLAASDDRYYANKRRLEDASLNSFYQTTASIQAAYSTLTMSLVDADMTGKQRREMIWKSFASTVIQQLTQLAMRHVALSIIRQKAEVSAATTSIAANQSAQASSSASAVVMIAKWLAVAASKIYAFFASLGPFGIPAAAATVAGIVAAVRAIKFERGGIVGGSSIRDTVPALLRSGERVISADQYRANASNIERAIGGVSGGGNAYSITINTDKQLGYGDILVIERIIEERLPNLFERLIERRALRPGLAF